MSTLLFANIAWILIECWEIEFIAGCRPKCLLMSWKNLAAEFFERVTFRTLGTGSSSSRWRNKTIACREMIVIKSFFLKDGCSVFETPPLSRFLFCKPKTSRYSVSLWYCCHGHAILSSNSLLICILADVLRMIYTLDVLHALNHCLFSVLSTMT